VVELHNKYLAIEPIISYTNVDIFREKRAKSFSKKGWELLNFMKKWVKKIIADFFVVISFKIKSL
jgi:hypothetical protein